MRADNENLVEVDSTSFIQLALCERRKKQRKPRGKTLGFK